MSFGVALAASVAPACAVERVEIPIVSASPQTDVISSVVRLHVPMLPGAAPHPEACDWIAYERFRSGAGPTDATQSDAVAVLIPGILEGATAFDPLARNAVREAARRGRHIEIWAIDRRANCLEDHTGTDAAEATGDASAAIDYYFRGTSIDGKTFAGFRQNDRVLADIGIAQTMHDYHAVLTTELPSQPWREQHVICGGHSLGGPLTEIYASWDFDGKRSTTDDAGYRQCAGFIGFDTMLNAGTVDAKRTASKDLLGAVAGGLLGAATKATTDAIKAGRVPRHVDLLGIAPDTMTLLELVGVRAFQDPDVEATAVVQDVPKTASVEAFFHLAGSADLRGFVASKASLRDLRYSNMALLGQIMDDNGAALGLVRSSFGYFDGVPLRRNKLPEQAWLIPGLGTLVSPDRLMLPAYLGKAKQPLARWRNYDALGSGDTQLGKGVTAPNLEVTDASEFARILHEGPLSLTENWFPIRMMADLALLAAGDRTASLAGSKHGSKMTSKPRIAVIAGDGIMVGNGKAVDPRVVAEGYQHLDVVTAAEQQNDGRPEISSQTLANFIDQAVAR